MYAYLLKRLLLFIPTLLVISMLAFALSQMAPGDPVLQYLDASGESSIESKPSFPRIYSQAKKKIGQDKPLFYLSLRPKAYPDTLYRILTQAERQAANDLIAITGNWPAVKSYQQSVKDLFQKSRQLPDSLGADALVSIRRRLRELRFQSDTTLIRKRLDLHHEAAQEAGLLSFLEPEQSQLKESYKRLMSDWQRQQLYQPKVSWYGFNNQYHHWLLGVLTGDMGYSFRDGRKVSQKIGDALSWTILINGFAILIAYALSIFLGVFMARRKGKPIDRITSLGLFILYSLPSFWIATLLLIFFTTPDYGMQFFSITQISDLSPDASFAKRFIETARHMVLPVFCLAYGAIAVISLQMRGGMLDVLKQDYIRTAYAKGLDEKQVIWKHAFRNALFPIITILGALFPATIAGSVVIENIFNIPGMGQLMIESIGTKDWPVVYIIMLFSAILTMAGILIADILYAIVDPRVRYK